MTPMLLADCLARTPSDQILRMARQAGLSPGAQRRDLETALMAQLTDPARLGQVLSNLGPEEWEALKVVYWGGGGQGITVELCHQVVNLLAGRRRQGAAQALLHLLDRGLIFTRKTGYREVYFIPAELQPALSGLLTERMAERVAVRDATAGPDPGASDLVEDLYRLLAFVFKQEVPLTQGGLIFKRHLRALVELLGAEPAGTDDEELLPGRYPEPLGFLAGFALDFHLLARADGYLRPGTDLDFWLRRPEPELRAALFEYWEDRYYYPDLQAFLHLSRAVTDGWIAVPAAAAELEPMLHPSQRAPLLARLQHHLTHFLGPVRAFDLAQTPGGDLMCRLTPAGRELLGNGKAAQAGGAPGEGPKARAHAAATHESAAAYRFVLQPTGELVAPRPVPLPVLWHLEVLGDLKQRGPALVYDVNRDTIYRSLKAGFSGDDLLGFLQRHSRSGLPQNLEFDITAWCRAYGQVYFQEVCLLRCSDPVLAAQIKAGRRTGRFVRGEVSPTALMVVREDYEALLQALLAEGLLPRPGIERMTPAAPEEKK